MRLDVTDKMQLSIYNNVLAIPIKQMQTAQELMVEQETANHPYQIEITQKRPKKTKSQLGYFWTLADQLAEHKDIHMSKEEMYAKLIVRYGKAEPDLLSVIEEAADMVYRITEGKCRLVGEGIVNGKTFKHFRVFVGCSKYDTKEMNILIDGTRSECEEVGIPVETPDEVARLKEDWNEGVSDKAKP